MLPWYLGSFLLGGTLIGASIVLGGGDDLDADVDIDVDVDVDVDVDADFELEVDADADADLDADADADGVDTGAWLPFLSLRFWTFALMAFGLTGALAHLLVSVSLPVEVGASAMTGLGVGWGAAWAFRKLKQSDISGDTTLQGLEGTEAVVVLPVSPGGTGKVRAIIDGHAVDLLARTSDDAVLPRKEPVLIVTVTDGVAVVTPLRRLPAPESAPPAV